VTLVAVPFALGVIVLAVAVLLRAAPRVVWPQYQGTDAYYHHAYIRLIRETGHRLPRRNPRIVGPGNHAYPALFHWLLSFLPPRQVRWVDRFGGVTGDLVVGGATSGLLCALGVVDIGTAVAAAGLYLLLPGLILPHIGPRAFTLTPRVWGQTFYALGVVCWIAADAYPQAWIISVLPLALMLLTSKFAVQNLVFVAPLAALLMGRYEPLLASAAAVVLALLLFRAMFVRQLVGQIGHLTWYLRRNQEMVAHRSNWRALVGALRALDMRRFAAEALWHNPLVSGLIRHFPLVLALGLARSSELTSAPGGFALALTLAAVVPWLVTAFGPARILGESERYLEFAAPAAWVLLWAANPSPAIVGLIVVSVLVGYSATTIFMHRTQTGFGGKEEADIAQVLADDAVLLCLHDPESYYFLATTEVRLVKYNGDLTAFGDAGRFIAQFFWRYPYVDPARLPDLIRDGGVTHVLENRRGRARLVAQSGRDYDIAGLDAVHRNDAYVLYSVRPSA